MIDDWLAEALSAHVEMNWRLRPRAIRRLQELRREGILAPPRAKYIYRGVVRERLPPGARAAQGWQPLPGRIGGQSWTVSSGVAEGYAGPYRSMAARWGILYRAPVDRNAADLVFLSAALYDRLGARRQYIDREVIALAPLRDVEAFILWDARAED